jgi:hypothetical protein
LPVIGVGALYLRYRHLPKRVTPSLVTTALLWVVTAVMAGFAAYYLVMTLR